MSRPGTAFRGREVMELPEQAVGLAARGRLSPRLHSPPGRVARPRAFQNTAHVVKHIVARGQSHRQATSLFAPCSTLRGLQVLHVHAWRLGTGCSANPRTKCVVREFLSYYLSLASRPPCNVPAPDNGTRLDSHNH
jgi:hypothetical protein